MAKSADFWDKVAEKYYRDPISDLEAYEAGLARVRHWLMAEMSVLEFGCGTGMTALKLASEVRAYTGTDVSPEMIRLAQGRLADENLPHVSFVAAAADLAGADGDYDAILAFNLLHLVPDVEQTIKHARRVLPEGGLFISKTPCLGGKFYFSPLIKAMQWIGKAPEHVHMLRATRIVDLLESNGFEVMEQGGYPPKLPSQLIVARAV